MILYLHGFLSSGMSAKGQWLKNQFLKHNIECFTPTYPIGNPELSVSSIQSEIDRLGLNNSSCAWMIMGSSMGGFYGQYFAQKYQVPLIMINPALDPIPLFEDYLGTHINPQTQEAFNLNQAYLESLKQYYCQPCAGSQSQVYLDAGDEVIPYEIALTAYQSIGEVVVFKEGDHGFQHLEEAWPDILAFTEHSLQS